MDRREFSKLTLAGAGLTIFPRAARTANLPAIGFNKHHFEINGEPVHLYSGEFHYFRVPKSDWRRRMQLLKDAGGNCLATYIPWLFTSLLRVTTFLAVRTASTTLKVFSRPHQKSASM